MTEQTPIGPAFDRLAAAQPARPALTVGGVTITRAELASRSNRLARVLGERGVIEGDLVTIALPNGVQFIEMLLAVWKVGATPQAVSHRLPPAELAAIVELARPRVVVGDIPLAMAVERLPAGFAPAPGGDDGPLPPRIAPSWKAPTSGGSTGRPKIIVSTKPGVAGSITGIAGTVGIRAGTTVLMTGPLYHNGPLQYAATTLLLGGHLVLMERFDARRALELIGEHRVEWMYAVPTMMHRMLRAGAETYDLRSLRTLFHLAAPCPPWLKRAWMDLLGPGAVLELYGGTEGQAATIVGGHEWLQRPGTVGRAVVGEICIRDAHGLPVPPRVMGEVYLRAKGGPTYRYVGAEARALDGGWESLGDLGWMDEDGYLYLGDRSTDMILVGGANVYPAEVEGALEEHPAVASACVIGLPDDDLGSRVHALVQELSPVTNAGLAAHLATRLAPYKRPRSYERVGVPLRDDSGKVRRSALRAERVVAKAPGPGHPVEATTAGTTPWN